jgi:large subunit ribosomal protein L22e
MSVTNVGGSDHPVRDAATRSLSVAQVVGKRPSAALVVGGVVAVGVAGYLLATHLVGGKTPPVAAAAVASAATVKTPPAASAAPAPTDTTPVTSIDDLPTAQPTTTPAARVSNLPAQRTTIRTAPAAAPPAAAKPTPKHTDSIDDLISGRK